MNNQQPQHEPGTTKRPRFIPSRWAVGRRRGSLTLALCIAGLALALVVCFRPSLEENSSPVDTLKRGLPPGFDRSMTQPLDPAPGQSDERAGRQKINAATVESGLPLNEAIARFLDEATGFAERRHYARHLARVGSPECIAALRRSLHAARPGERALLAQWIGETGNPAMTPLLWPLLDDAHEGVIIGAIRGLSAIGGDQVTTRVAELLWDSRRGDSIRGEAALALGTIGTPAAGNALAAAFRQQPAGELAGQILSSLGRFEFPTVATLFGDYLADTRTPGGMRVIAVEALAHSSQEAVPFLLGLAQRDSDSGVRASAAWAISAHEKMEDIAPALAGLAEKEPAADVRRRLYEALAPQAAIPGERLLPQIRAETDIAARVAGFNALGSAAGQEPDSAFASVFDRDIVPELLQIATAPNSLNIQMRAVFALRRAQTPDARAALAVIAGHPRPQIATAARNGLQAALTIQQTPQ